MLYCLFVCCRLCLLFVLKCVLKILCASPGLQKESVALALRLLDESEMRGYQLHVEAARFELKGTYDASKKKKKSKEYRKRLKQQQKYV